MSHPSKSSGFTLIELLVVIAIMAILAGVALPVLSKGRQAGLRASCMSNLHQVGIAFRMYLDEYDEIMPIAADMPSLKLNNDPRIADVLAPYLGDPKVLKCPADQDKNYFLSEGSSYQYVSMLGGKKVSQSFLTKRWGEEKTPILFDYEPFHGDAGMPGAMNYLFADSHVGDLK